MRGVYCNVYCFRKQLASQNVIFPLWRNRLKSTCNRYHELIANAGYFLIGFHALAALFHHYIERDNTLERMLPLLNRQK
ncbi:cytochrome b [Lelliottia sp.]|uniref:cytochrome b n=1 Tax=Lelliottia sp. TaxID=1898429 RepID=UPI00388FB33E